MTEIVVPADLALDQDVLQGRDARREFGNHDRERFRDVVESSIARRCGPWARWTRWAALRLRGDALRCWSGTARRGAPASGLRCRGLCAHGRLPARRRFLARGGLLPRRTFCGSRGTRACFLLLGRGRLLRPPRGLFLLPGCHEISSGVVPAVHTSSGCRCRLVALVLTRRDSGVSRSASVRGPVPTAGARRSALA